MNPVELDRASGSFASPAWRCPRDTPSQAQTRSSPHRLYPPRPGRAAASTGQALADTRARPLRTPDRSLDSSTSTSTRNDAPRYELSPARFIAQRRGRPLPGSAGTGKSTRAGIGRARHPAGLPRPLPRAHTSSRDRRRHDQRQPQGVLADLAAVPLLILDDLGMRKLPPPAAVRPLELVSAATKGFDHPDSNVRSMPGASFLATPPPSRGSSIGCSTTHTLKCGPRSWRTQVHSTCVRKRQQVNHHPVSTYRRGGRI